jgi:hypothetical protein
MIKDVIMRIVTPHRYQYIEHELLRLTLLGSGDGLGYSTSLPTLQTHFRAWFPDIGDREIVAASQRLHRQQHLAVWKWSPENNRHLEFPGMWNEEDFFHRGEFRLRTTPYTDPRLQELAELFPPADPDQPKKQYGFA